MSIATTMSETGSDVVPEDYTEFFKTYYSYCKRLVFTYGIDEQSVEDVTMSILSKFYENAVLEDFDPNYRAVYDGVARKAMFRTFLTGFVKTYVQHYRNRQRINKLRELTIVDSPMSENATWLDVFGSHVHDAQERAEVVSLVISIRKHLASRPPRFETCDLPELFEFLLCCATKLGAPDSAKIMEHFGVSATTVKTRMKALRAEVQKILSI